METEKKYLFNLLKKQLNNIENLKFYIDISYERYPDMSLQLRCEYVRGLMYVENHDDLEISNKRNISEDDFYNAVDSLLLKAGEKPSSSTFELGVDEGYYIMHFEQITMPLNYYYSKLSGCSVVGSTLFHEIHKLELLEQILNQKYKNLLLYKKDDDGNNYLEKYTFKEKLVELFDWFINKNIDSCLSVVAANYYMSIRKTNFNSFIDAEADYWKTKAIPNELKGDGGLLYIKEYYSLLCKLIEKEKNKNKNSMKYYDYSNELIEYLHEKLMKDKQKKEDADFQSFFETYIANYEQYKKVLNNMNLPMNHFSASIAMGLDNYPLADFESRKYIILGMIKANYFIDYEKEYKMMDYNLFESLLEKIYSDIRIKNEKHFDLVKTGVEFACYNYYEELILKSGDIFLNSLASKYQGLNLFYKSMRFRDVYYLFSSIYPNALHSVYDEVERVFLDNFNWLKYLIEYYYNYDNMDALSFLSVNYFKDLLSQKYYGNFDNEQSFQMYMDSDLVPSFLKNEFALKMFKKDGENKHISKELKDKTLRS